MGTLKGPFVCSIVVKLSLLLVIIIFDTKIVNGSTTSIEVDTTNGRIRGVSAKSREGKPYYQFLGIPYALPPLEKLRFEPPQKPENWTGVRETEICQKPCIQFEAMFLGRIQGVEDCLYLNVFTPNIRMPDTNLMPVMVFIHGGGHMSGGPSMYRGKYFMDEEIVLVTLAFRLGSFGFLSTGDELIRGNMALKDQNLALQWVQDNIEKFGGDPSRVTLFGESSGGVCSHLHMMSPKSRGLFHKAISQSGSGIRKYQLSRDMLGQAKYLASKVGCPTGNVKEMVVCLKKVNARQIAEVHREAMEAFLPEFAIYGPTVEVIKDKDAFLTEEPIELLRTGNYNKVPWITGVNSADGILFATRLIQDRQLSRSLENEQIWESKLSRILRYDEAPSPESAADKIRNFYFGQASPIQTSSFQNLTNMFSDRMYLLPAHRAAQLQYVHSPVYMYYFDYKTTASVLKLAEAVQRNSRIIPAEVQIARYFVQTWFQENILGVNRPYYGAAHGDELFLLFNLNIILEARYGTADYDASRAFVKIWTDFAKKNETDPVLYGSKQWPLLTPNDASIPYLQFGEKVSIVSEPFEERINFWKSLNLTHHGLQL